jgi:transcriptional regulator MraZ
LAFRGHYEHSLDSKDRLTVPAKFRAPLSAGVVLSVSLDPCVEVWPPDDYATHSEVYIGSLSPLSPEGRLVRRFFHGGSFDDSLDSAGRIRLSRHLIEHAKLSGACVLVGMFDHFEVWDAKRWAKQERDSQASVVGAAEKLAAASQ